MEKNLGLNDSAVLQIGGGPSWTITTDTFGFINNAYAIQDFKYNRHIDIAGIGASYFVAAQSNYYDFFNKCGYFYYSFAQSRFSQPQFNLALENCALKSKPKLVVYEFNEVSYTLIDDVEQWKKSDIDWYTYHSGYWSGPPIKIDPFHNFIRKFPVVDGIWTQTMKKLLSPKSKDWFEKEKLYKKTFAYIKDAHDMSIAAGSSFVVLMIPVKETAVGGPDAYSPLFNAMIPRLNAAGIDYIDLRKTYGAMKDPKSLYLEVDGHWNIDGIYKAVMEIYKYIQDNQILS